MSDDSMMYQTSCRQLAPSMEILAFEGSRFKYSRYEISLSRAFARLDLRVLGSRPIHAEWDLKAPVTIEALLEGGMGSRLSEAIGHQTTCRMTSLAMQMDLKTRL